MPIERQQNPFDTPVPGQSLTDTPKNYPWENPPRFVDTDKAASFVWDKLHKKDTASKIIILLEAGVSVESLTKVVIFSGFLEGAFTPDVGFLLTPIVEKMILSMGKASGVKKINLNKPKQKQTQKVLESLFKSRDITMDMNKMSKKNEDIEKKESKAKGLMERGEE